MMAHPKPNVLRYTPQRPQHKREAVTSAVNEWGVPDWRDKEAYGNTSTWSFARWRWEFYRRLADVRETFDAKKNVQYEHRYSFWQISCNRPGLAESERDAILSNEPIPPDHPDFVVSCNTNERERCGYATLYNPRIGDRLFGSQDEPSKSVTFYMEGRWIDGILPEMPVETHELVIKFSLDRPLQQQLRDVERALKSLQKERHGRLLQKRHHPKKWLGYLRVLDAREAGASWAEIAEAFYLQGLLRRYKDPSGGYCPPPPQAARDLWEAANALRFNL